MVYIKKIIIHCSQSNFGTVEEIEKWHKELGWDGFGYHYLIENGFPEFSSSYTESHDGLIEKGRPDNVQGAHCLGHNRNSLGICLIGRRMFTHKQLFISLPALIFRLMQKHQIPFDDIYGHGEFNKKKTCPNFDMDNYRDFLRVHLTGAEFENWK